MMCNSKSLTHRLQHNSYQGQDVDLFHLLRKMSLCPLATKLSLYFQPLAATDLFLHFSDYYINRIIKYAAFELASFIWQNALEIHPGYYMHQCFSLQNTIPLHGCTTVCLSTC